MNAGQDPETVEEYVVANHALLTNLNQQLSEQHQEHMAAMQELTAISRAQLEIAQEYKTWVGDPLRKGSYAISVIRSVFVWVAWTLLTLWGLREIFNTYFVPKLKP